MRRHAWLLSLGVAFALALDACSCDPELPEGPSPLGDGFASLVAVSATSLVLKLSRPIDVQTVGEAKLEVASYTVVPPEQVSVSKVEATTAQELAIGVATLTAGQVYTLSISGLRDLEGYELAGTLNFTGPGASEVVQVEIRISDVQTARRHEELVLLATVSAETGLFSERLQMFPVTDEGDHFRALIDVAVDPNRTLDSADNGDVNVDRRPYGVRLTDLVGRPASPLKLFVLPSSEAARVVELTVLPPPESPVTPNPTDPLPDPPVDPNPGDGKKVVRVVVDDRQASALTAPSLRLSFDADGVFDASFPRTVALSTIAGSGGYWEAIVEVAVDPNRVEDGSSEATFPYFAYLVEGGTEYENLSVVMIAPVEEPETVLLPLGQPGWTPVTFFVDASRAYLTADGSQRGVFPGEAVYITGEWQQAVDVFGNNAGDAFSGGEQLNLRMRLLDGHPGVWSRTLWLPPGRPYGWKVLRCDAQFGCGPLNQVVASAGRAFATVMKNLATDNKDAFGDAAVGIVDPLSPATTQAGGTTWDYTNAAVYDGLGVGAEPGITGTPDGLRMFKQEVPDLVVVVGDQALKTRVVHVGTWRDVNIEDTPAELVASSGVVQLAPYDYDDGMVGRFPPSREEP
jgi:hypothetical protein